MNRCLACGHLVSRQLFNPGPQPLSALNLPRSESEAVDANRFPMNFRCCGICGHVWNTDFEYTKVPYAGDSNLMYNSGALWQDHMQMLVSKLAENKAMWVKNPVIDIGCGDGQFLSLLLKAVPEAKCVGFEPGIDGTKITEFECVQDYFRPERDIAARQPSLLICRHVLEHIADPRDFIASVAYWCGQCSVATVFLAEVPCCEKALESGRVSDFLYEHVSNFTLNSLYAMFGTSGFKLLETSRLYGDEVVVGFFQPHEEALKQNHRSMLKFSTYVQDSRTNIQLKQSNLDGDVVLWGGTGKSAAFLNMFGFDADRFPVVVDSDPLKVGRYVPGTGQRIDSPDSLVGRTPTIIITTAWRANDIYAEINRRGIRYKSLLVLKDGDLNEYTQS